MSAVLEATSPLHLLRFTNLSRLSSLAACSTKILVFARQHKAGTLGVEHHHAIVAHLEQTREKPKLEETLANEKRSIGLRHTAVASGSLISMVSWLECLELPCHEIASALASLGVAHGELGDTVQQCQLLQLSLTTFLEVCPSDSTEGDAVTAVFAEYCEALLRIRRWDALPQPTKFHKFLSSGK
eukprot:6095217-Amphidinium_carterae.1